MGGEVIPDGRLNMIRAKCLAFRSIQTRFDDSRFYSLFKTMPDKAQEDMLYHALRGEYTQMMQVFDASRRLADYDLVELRALATQWGFKYVTAMPRGFIIKELAKKGLT